MRVCENLVSAPRSNHDQPVRLVGLRQKEFERGGFYAVEHVALVEGVRLRGASLHLPVAPKRDGFGVGGKACEGGGKRRKERFQICIFHEDIVF